MNSFGHAQELSEEVMYKHIELYVNKIFSSIGLEGRDAITKMFEKAQELDSFRIRP